jgi:hypothetical protein
MDRPQAKAWLKDFRTSLQSEFERNPARRNETATEQAITEYHDVIDRLWAGGGANLSAYKVPAGCTWQQLFDAVRSANRLV